MAYDILFASRESPIDVSVLSRLVSSGWMSILVRCDRSNGSSLRSDRDLSQNVVPAAQDQPTATADVRM